MCCRFRLGLEKYDTPEVDKLEKKFKEKYPDAPFKKGDIFPSDEIATLIKGTKDKADVGLMKWGIKALNNKLVINAKVETIQEKPMFKYIEKNRCIILATGFYEWSKDESHTQYYFQNKTEFKPIYIGAIYDNNQIPNFVIITKEPTEDIKDIHDRMPLIIDERDVNNFLNDTTYKTYLLMNKVSLNRKKS